jgi:hypothetical protein
VTDIEQVAQVGSQAVQVSGVPSMISLLWQLATQILVSMDDFATYPPSLLQEVQLVLLLGAEQ